MGEKQDSGEWWFVWREGCGGVKIVLSSDTSSHAHSHPRRQLGKGIWDETTAEACRRRHLAGDIWEETSEERHLGIGIWRDSGQTWNFSLRTLA